MLGDEAGSDGEGRSLTLLKYVMIQVTCGGPLSLPGRAAILSRNTLLLLAKFASKLPPYASPYANFSSARAPRATEPMSSQTVAAEGFWKLRREHLDR